MLRQPLLDRFSDFKDSFSEISQRLINNVPRGQIRLQGAELEDVGTITA